jgi:sugar lactone lactonase YvrE
MAPKVVFKGIAFPEALRWHKGELWFSDVLSGVAYRGDVTTGELHKEVEIAPFVSGIGWLTSGELLVVDCEKRSVMRRGPRSDLSLHADLSGHWKYNANDMLVDAENTVWVGTYGFNPESDSPVAADLARIVDGKVDFPIGGLVFANGIARIDADRIVVAETFADRISVIQTSGDVKLLKQIDLPKNATPDGLVVDNQGFAWIALAYSEAILRVNLETGEMERAIEISGTGVYDCTFGGPNLDILYVATSDTDETNMMRDLPGKILSFDLSINYPGVHGLGNK